MRLWTIPILALAFAAHLAAAGSVSAAPGDSPPAPRQNEAVTPRAATLDELFERLRRSKDESEAKGLATTIQRRWLRSGSDTSDLLMSRAMEVASEDQALAIELLDRVVALQPEWAEAWN